MKYILVFIFIFPNIITANSQSLLIKKDPKKSFKYDLGKYFDQKEYKLLSTPKISGTFIFTGKPLKANTLILKLNGKVSLLPIEGILIPPPQKRTIPANTIKLQAKFLLNRSKGKAYTLPQDNMPCMVPDINSNMPVVILDLNNYKKIPNAGPEQRLPPEILTVPVLPNSNK